MAETENGQVTDDELKRCLRDYECESLPQMLREVAKQSKHCTSDAGGRIPTWPLIEAAERLEALALYTASHSTPAQDEAALADLALDYLHLAQPEFCSARCPSVGREGVPIPHLPECVSMRSLLDGLPFATPGATISTGLMAKLKKLANYLTERGEYEACDLIDTVVDRLSASHSTPEFGPLDPASQNLGTWEPARDEALEGIGPRCGKLVCKGCPAYETKAWSEIIEDESDSGQYAWCNAADRRSMGSYHYDHDPAPEWCPVRAKLAAPSEKATGQ